MVWLPMRGDERTQDAPSAAFPCRGFAESAATGIFNSAVMNLYDRRP
jgi:hypothetical protein